MGNASPRSRCGPTRKIYADGEVDRKSTRLNSSHSQISYAVFCLKKKKEHTLRRVVCSTAWAAVLRASTLFLGILLPATDAVDFTGMPVALTTHVATATGVHLLRS